MIQINSTVNSIKLQVKWKYFFFLKTLPLFAVQHFQNNSPSNSHNIKITFIE